MQVFKKAITEFSLAQIKWQYSQIFEKYLNGQFGGANIATVLGTMKYIGRGDQLTVETDPDMAALASEL